VVQVVVPMMPSVRYNNYHPYLINPVNRANVTDGLVGLAGKNESFFLMENMFCMLTQGDKHLLYPRLT